MYYFRTYEIYRAWARGLKKYPHTIRGDTNTIPEKSIEFISTETKDPHLTFSKHFKERIPSVSLQVKEILFPDHNTVNMAVLLCSVFFYLFVSVTFKVQSISKTCHYQGKNYTECDLMFWTDWNTCTGGHGMKPTECAIGMEKRQNAICCPRYAINETQTETARLCKINCNKTDDDFEEVRRLTTTGRF